MVSAGDYGAARAGKRPARTAVEAAPQISMGGVIAGLACVALLAVATFTSQEGGASPTELRGKDLHLANSVNPKEVSKVMAVTSGRSVMLKAAKTEAEKHLQKAKVTAEMAADNKETSELKNQLDADVKMKQSAALKLSRSKMQDLMSQSKEAKQAQNLKVKVTNADSSPDGDSKEESALRKQLNAEATAEQSKMLDQSMPQLAGLKKSSKMTVQVTEAQLEKQLRAKLNSRVKKEKEGMYKSAMQGWLSKEAGVTNSVKQATGAAPAAAQGGGIESNSLQAAEKIMKLQLTGAAPKATDTTVSHAGLGARRVQATAAKVSGLDALESAMLTSTLHNSKGVAAEMKSEGVARAALREAAAAKQATMAKAKPTYSAAMMKFTKRLNDKEQHQETRYGAKTVALRKKFNQASKKDLEAAIQRKVTNRLDKGSSRLNKARAQLMQMFKHGATSPFAKAELAQLKSYQEKQSAKVAALGNTL
ncbi:hypothetical protein T484DRAFT_1834867 [Baffinella frigidus]|nr:hypothetical protein T484DRAFT_1834867 [Cryptophyta sp. CCMP2293]